jgi:hypothetical protein
MTEVAEEGSEVAVEVIVAASAGDAEVIVVGSEEAVVVTEGASVAVVEVTAEASVAGAEGLVMIHSQDQRPSSMINPFALVCLL